MQSLDIRWFRNLRWHTHDTSANQKLLFSRSVRISPCAFPWQRSFILDNIISYSNLWPGTRFSLRATHSFWKWRMIIAVNFPISNWKEEAWKKSGLQRDSNPWPPRYRCAAPPTELWSHTLGARSIYWVHISREEWNELLLKCCPKCEKVLKGAQNAK